MSRAAVPKSGEEPAGDGDAIREGVDEKASFIKGTLQSSVAAVGGSPSNARVHAVDGVTAHVGVEVGVAGGESHIANQFRCGRWFHFMRPIAEPTPLRSLSFRRSSDYLRLL